MGQTKNQLPRVVLTIGDPSGISPEIVRATKGDLDGILTMHHDQEEIATKLLGIDVGVTVLGGLSRPVTQAAYGIAYEIVGHGVANPFSLGHAINQAYRMAIRQNVPAG